MNVYILETDYGEIFFAGVAVSLESAKQLAKKNAMEYFGNMGDDDGILQIRETIERDGILRLWFYHGGCSSYAVRITEHDVYQEGMSAVISEAAKGKPHNRDGTKASWRAMISVMLTKQEADTLLHELRTLVGTTGFSELGEPMHIRQRIRDIETALEKAV